MVKGTVQDKTVYNAALYMAWYRMSERVQCRGGMIGVVIIG